jgi:hypothetical protein
VRDQARRHAGAAGDLRERAADEAELGETVDRDVDQLSAAVVLEALGRATAVVVGTVGAAAFV